MIRILAETEIAIARIEDIQRIALFLKDGETKDLVVEVIGLLNITYRQEDDRR